MALYGQLPAYDVGRPLEFQPLAQGLGALGGYLDRRDKRQQFSELMADPRLAESGINPAMLEVARSMGYEQGPNALMGAYQQQQQRELALQDRDLRERQFERQMGLSQQQLRLQQLQEQRARETMGSEIDLRRAQADQAKTAAENARVDSDMMRQLMGASQPLQPRTAAPPNAGAAPPLPGPVIPQSGDGFNPAMVQPVADGQAQSPRGLSGPDSRVVETPFGSMPIEQARRLGGLFALRGKNEAAKQMEHAIERSGLGKSGQTEIDKKAVDTGELAMRLDGIMGKFKPEYQTLATQLKMYGADTADWLGMSSRVPAAMRQQLAEYTAFRQDSMNNLSQYIKEVTGAAMGVQEEKRIRAGMPDPQKDGPTAFEAKLRNATTQAKYALARYNYLQKQGYDPGALSANRERLSGLISLDDMPRVINQRGADLKKQIVERGMPPDQADQFVMRQLKQEFGI